MNLPKSTWYSGGTFYDIITHHSIKQLYYDRYQYNPYQTHGSSNLNKHQRVLHNSASIITIPQQLFGEKIKPKSGRVVIFPASFTHLHRGKPPYETKYIATGWLATNTIGQTNCIL